MGSNRDGVRVPDDKHGVRVAAQVRAAERAGQLPDQQEVPRHQKKRKGGRKPWKVEANFCGNPWTWGWYKNEKRAREGFKAICKSHRRWIKSVRLVGPDSEVLMEQRFDRV